MIENYRSGFLDIDEAVSCLVTGLRRAGSCERLVVNQRLNPYPRQRGAVLHRMASTLLVAGSAVTAVLEKIAKLEAVLAKACPVGCDETRDPPVGPLLRPGWSCGLEEMDERELLAPVRRELERGSAVHRAPTGQRPGVEGIQHGRCDVALPAHRRRVA